MRRVLILCEYPTVSGGERSILAMLGPLRAAGWEPHAACPGEGPLAEAFRAAGVEVSPLGPRCAARDGPSRQRRREWLAECIRRLRPEVFHANSVAMARLSGPVVASLGQPSLAHLRDIVGLSRQAVADIHGHGRLLAVSHAVRNYHAAAGIDAARQHVLYNGVDLERFRPRAPTGWLHRELRLPRGARLLGTIGQIGPRKGQDVLLAAAKQLARRYDDVHWLIVGRRFSGKEESVVFERRLREATAVGALRGRWHWLDWRDDIPELLGELTALVHPARQEPLGRVLLEAAACGVAVVASDVGGTAEIFAPLGGEPPAFGAAGLVGPTDAATAALATTAALLVPPDDAAALADAVGRLLDDEPLRRRLGADGRRIAEGRFDAVAVGARLAEHYEAVGAGLG